MAVTREQAIAELRKRGITIDPAAMQSASAMVGSAKEDISRGFTAGLTREKDFKPEGGLQSAAAAIGRGAPAMAGSLAAGAMTGGLGFIPAALASGGGAAAGELAGMGIAKAAGGEAPETIGEAVSGAGKVGLVAALTDLGIAAPAKIAGVALTKISDNFLRVPAEFIKRAITRYKINPKIIPIGRAEATIAEAEGVRKLMSVQRRVDGARRMAGEKVEAAIEGLAAKTKDQPVFDFSAVADRGRAAIDEIKGGDPAVLSALGPELKKIEGLINGIAAKPLRTAKEAIAVRRAIDSLTDFKRGAAREVSSEPGNEIMGQIGTAAREQIAETARAINYPALAKANEAFMRTINAIEPLRRAIASSRNDKISLTNTLKRFGEQYAQGAYRQAIIERTVRHVPEIQKPLDDLLDAVVRATLTGKGIFSPSGKGLNALRVIASPAYLKGVMKFGPGVKRAATTTAAGTAAQFND